jgi:outer membrane lipoprotein-sorting protein
MKATSRFLLLLVAILLSGLPVLAQPEQTDATTVLNKMFSVYSRFKSYQDEGLLITTFDEPTGGTIHKMPFKTFYKTPNLFRFEWTDYGISKLAKTKIIWSNGKDAFTYLEPDRYEKEEALSLAVAGATGISSGTVNTVLEMLRPNEFGWWNPKTWKDLSLSGEELFEGVSCYRLKAKDGDDLVELWVGKSDFLLRKLREESEFGDGLRIKEEIRRKIQVDHSIAEVVFNYKPPIPLTAKKEVDSAEVEKLLNPGPPVWTEFKSEEGRFSILMPDKPQSTSSTFESPQGRFEQHLFIASHHPTLVFMVAYTDIPKQLLVDKYIDGFFDQVRDEFIKSAEGKLASDTPLTVDGHPAREVKVHVFKGELRLRMFLVGERAYMLSVMHMEKPDEEITKKFFSSFKLSPITRSIASAKRR